MNFKIFFVQNSRMSKLSKLDSFKEQQGCSAAKQKDSLTAEGNLGWLESMGTTKSPYNKAHVGDLLGGRVKFTWEREWKEGGVGQEGLPFYGGYSACAQRTCAQDKCSTQSRSCHSVTSWLQLMTCPARSPRAGWCKCLNANTI